MEVTTCFVGAAGRAPTRGRQRQIWVLEVWGIWGANAIAGGAMLRTKKAPARMRRGLAVRTRFELVVGLLLRQFSKLVVSATHPPHRVL